jgi:membrane fusion protein, multidrug efflux system
LTAVYVLDAKARPQLRLVRAGRTAGGSTEILAGLEPGEKVVLDPLAAIPKR